MKAVIIDDERFAISLLSKMIVDNFPEISELKTTNHPLEGIDLINTFKPEILFIDIEMPHMNGFELLSQLENAESINVIFTTAYNQYAIKAIRFSALDYLLKPIQLSELKEAIARHILQKNERVNRLDRYHNLLYNLRGENQNRKRIAIHSSDGNSFVEISEIIYLQGDNNYTYIFTQKRKYALAKTLKEFEEILSEDGFFRSHKSIIVNLNEIKSIDADQIVLKNNLRVAVSRRRKQELELALLYR
jgi:two-component system LytT family response regulator